MRRANDGAMYVGRLVGSSMFNIDRMLVAYFLTSAAVGYYALAFSLVAPITLGVQSIAIAGYAKMARSAEIPRNVLCASFGWLAASGVLGYVLITVFVERFLPAYRPTLGILLPAILTAVVLGVVALFNQFLSAHGRGRTLRRISFVFAIANLGLYFVADPSRRDKGRGICEPGNGDGAARRSPHRVPAVPFNERAITASVDLAGAHYGRTGARAS